MTDRAGAICLMNTRLQGLLKLDSVPKTVDDLLSRIQASIPDMPALIKDMPDTPSEGKWGSLRIQGQAARRLNWHQQPLQDQGQVQGWLTIFWDIADQENSLELGKQSFLSMISHDLRTPLSTILGFAELLYHNRGNLSDDEQKEFVEHIIKNASQLSQYTQIALDIMFLEANESNFDVEPVPLYRFVRHWLSDAIHRFPARRLVFHNGVSEGSLTQIAPSALHKIMNILVEFALAESSPEDSVDIRLHFDDALAHILMLHKAPKLTAADAAVLFRLMQARDLSEAGRPDLHRMQLYVASLLAERQQGYLLLSGQGDDVYQIDLALPLVAEK
ncbi:MAG: hypothetical protein GYB65_23390 [Chloroflexi bacterium]|nr:hypothetical protein [Chloroflexota bacterium]